MSVAFQTSAPEVAWVEHEWRDFLQFEIRMHVVGGEPGCNENPHRSGTFTVFLLRLCVFHIVKPSTRTPPDLTSTPVTHLEPGQRDDVARFDERLLDANGMLLISNVKALESV